MGRVILLNAIRRTDAPSQFVFRLEHDQGAADDLKRFSEEIDAIADVTEREEVRKARLGQGRFRERLLGLWGSRCAVTGVELPSVLTAAHIKPWRCANNAERLDPHNGLLILPQYDRLFDRGFISFADDGAVLLSPALPRDKFDLLGVREDARLTRVALAHTPFLAFHRERVFIRPDAQD
jgi:predicted restriction endonuclease